MTVKYYAVVSGRTPGIYTDWNTTKSNVNGYPGAIYKSFNSKNDAEAFMKASTFVPKVTNNIYHTQPLPDKTIIYTDGSFCNNSCGYGVVIITSSGEKITAYGKVPLSPTNNVAELYAIYVALSMVKGDVLLYTDSMYAINALTSQIHGWIATGWKNVANADLLYAIYNVMSGRNIQYCYSPGHIGIELNEEADVLANLGRQGNKHLLINKDGQLYEIT
jgi:ribonuclease HI